MDQTDTQRLTDLFASVAKTTYDSNPKLWDEVLTALNLDIRYQLTVAEVLQRGTWRNAKNAGAYISSAAVRSARGKKLPDYSEKEFRRVPSDEPNSDVGTRLDSGAEFDLENWGGGGVYERTPSGAMRYVDDSDDYDFDRQIPSWLQRGEEPDEIDWETVAAYAVRKPKMACQLAHVLITRYDRRLGRPEAMARAASAEEASAIEAAWKWIDRYGDERIVPLFKMAVPPRPLTAEAIASFPLLATGVSRRLDVEPQWDRRKKRLLLTRAGTFHVLTVAADSKREAIKLLSDAGEWDEPEFFHYWAIQSEADRVAKPEPAKPGEFAKPWEVLARRVGKTK